MKIEDLKQIAIYAAKGEAPANYTTESVDDSFLEGIRDLASDYYQFMDNRYAIYDIIVTAIDEVVPSRVADALAPIADIQVVGQGQKAIFKQRVGRNRARKFLTQVGLSGVYETFRLDVRTFEVSTQAVGGAAIIDFERMLDGAESMQEVSEIITEGLTEAVYQQVQRALRGALNATGRPDANKVISNTFDAEKMVKLINVVKAYGQTPVIFAPPEFVAAMGPDAIVPVGANYQGIYHPQDIDQIHNTGYINIFRGTPVVQIPQSFTDESNTTTFVDPQMAYVLPSDGEKVVKVALEGQTQIHDFQNRDNSMEIHAYRKMGASILAQNNWGIYQNTGITQTLDEDFA